MAKAGIVARPWWISSRSMRMAASRPRPRNCRISCRFSLEYAATRAPAEALELIGQPGHVFAALRERLAKRSSPYEGIFAALTALSRTKLNATALAALRAEADPEPDDLEALDAAWEERK